MNRFTISLDDQLARQFDKLIADKGFANRSEAVRDLIRYVLMRANILQIGAEAEGPRCVASVTFVYDQSEPSIAARVATMKQRHHDLVVNAQHTPFNANDCLETVTLRGSLRRTGICADQLTTIHGVRHSNMHLVSLSGADDKGEDPRTRTEAGIRATSPTDVAWVA